MKSTAQFVGQTVRLVEAVPENDRSAAIQILVAEPGTVF
jgi:hypothetical protein